MRCWGRSSWVATRALSIARAGLMGARKRSGGAQAGKRTWGRRRVRRIGVLRRAACGHQSGATFTHGSGEFGAH